MDCLRHQAGNHRATRTFGSGTPNGLGEFVRRAAGRLVFGEALPVASVSPRMLPTRHFHSLRSLMAAGAVTALLVWFVLMVKETPN
jgi:hypothetical protein